MKRLREEDIRERGIADGILNIFFEAERRHRLAWWKLVPGFAGKYAHVTNSIVTDVARARIVREIAKMVDAVSVVKPMKSRAATVSELSGS